MNRLMITVSTILIGCCFGFGVFHVSAPAQDSPSKPKQKAQQQKESEREDGRPITDLRQFMRAKLAASNKILEGLTTDDMALTLEGARTLNKMSLSEKWRVNNDAMYRQFSSEFRRVTRSLVQAAEDENPDQATLKWMGATMACIECHRYVRNTLIVDSREPN